MTIQLQTNGSGTVLETRTVSGRDRQMVGIAEPLRSLPTRGAATGRPVYELAFTDMLPGLWNDGLGFIGIDNDIPFNGRPTCRLDTNQRISSGTDPGRTANIGGVVAKLRIHDNFVGKWGVETWFRFTGLNNNTSNTKFSMSIYNRDGAQAKHFRVWLDPNGNNQPMHGRILNGVASAAANPGVPTTGPVAVYTDVVTSTLQNGSGSHNYDLPSGRLDRVGGWHFVKMVVDFSTGKYVSLQLDSQFVDLEAAGPYFWDITDSTGMAGMHHSFEYFANTSSRRFLNLAHVVGTLED